MSARRRLRVHAHPTGPWLVVWGRRRWAVAPARARRLRAWDGATTGAATVGALLGVAPPAADAPRGRGPRLRRDLLPGPLVARLARPLRPLTGGRVLALLAATGAAGLAWAGPPAGLRGGGQAAAALALFLGTALLHELAHAAALLRGGYPPGALGVGVMLVLPVLWCDVSAVALLPRRERLRVDLAGPAVQLAAAGVLALAGRSFPFPPGAAAHAASAAALAAAGWSLLPFVRSDGFWCLCDVAGVGDLDRRPEPGAPRRTVLLRSAYRVAHAAFLLAAGGALVRRVADAGRAAPWRLVAAALLAAALAGLVARRLAGLRVRHKADAPAAPAR